MLLAMLAPAFAEPLFSVERGWQDAPFNLELTAESGGSLYYSVDGSSPTIAYAGPIAVAGTTVVRAVEVAEDGMVSDVVTSTYLFLDQVLSSSVMDASIIADPEYGPAVARSLVALPVVSLVAPGGISLSEGPVSVEWMDPEGESGQVNAGAYVSGGTSWQYAKTSFRLVFRSEYGPGKLHLDLYGDDATGVRPVDDFDAISLRGGNHDTVFYLGARGQHLRNFWMDESQLEMGHIAPHGRFIHVFTNGVYHGLYHLRERFNAAMMAEYLGGDEDDYEAITAGNAFDGSGQAWAAAVASSSSFTEASRWLKMADYLDYMVLNYYAANAWDWYYYHNWQAAGPEVPDAGGFRFHSSDSDICLVYDWTTNILSLGGPSNIFLNLMAEGHPDFKVALADAIHRNLSGPLSAESAAERYSRLATMAEEAVVAESARWGYGWWDRDGEWATERDYLLYQWFPYRTDELLRQVRAAGWYPLDAPLFDLEPGLVEEGSSVVVSAPEASAAELWVTVDGSDPRQPGGAFSPSVLGPDGAREILLDRSTIVRARLKDGDTWGPIEEGFYEVDAPAPVVLNEWNSVDPDRSLEGGDSALGHLVGNGGDWIELLVREDVDLRGWTIEMEDRNGEAGRLSFSEDPLLATLRAGTIITIAEDLPEEASYDPDGGDWRFHLRAGEEGSGVYVSAAAFDVSARDWQLTLLDAEGRVRFGPVGEGVEPRAGISSEEVGQLAALPSASTRRDDPAYGAARSSTFGGANTWEGGEQDLGLLRGDAPDVTEVDDTGADPLPTPLPEDTGCGCGSGGTPGLLLGLGALALRRRRSA